MQKLILFTMFISFFAGGNIAIVVKDHLYKKTPSPVNYMGAAACITGMVIVMVHVDILAILQGATQ